MSQEKAGYTIGAVARIYGIHPQTLRAYERSGLLSPSRSAGNTRLYSEEDMEILAVILNLTRELGVNLAGVEVILNMRHKMEVMQKDVEELVAFLRGQFGSGFLDGNLEGIIKVPPSKLARFFRPGRD